MAPPELDDALAHRLERLTGEDADACSTDLRDDVVAIQGTGFDRALARHKALANDQRLLTASLLKRRGELCACEVQAALHLTHATVSHHMKQLVDAGVVRWRRDGKWVHYRLDDHVRDLVP